MKPILKPKHGPIDVNGYHVTFSVRSEKEPTGLNRVGWTWSTWDITVKIKKGTALWQTEGSVALTNGKWY